MGSTNVKLNYYQLLLPNICGSRYTKHKSSSVGCALKSPIKASIRIAVFENASGGFQNTIGLNAQITVQ